MSLGHAGDVVWIRSRHGRAAVPPRAEGGGPHYWPVPGRIVVAFGLVAAFTVSIFLVNVASYAYRRVGLDERWAFAVLFASILGSWCNVPVARLRGETTFEPVLVRVYGMLYVIPRPVRPGSKIVAVNVGGAVIPTVLSIYLVVRNDLFWIALVAVAMVAILTHAVARVVPGVGVVVPTFIPPLAAAVTAWVIDVEAIAALAYVAGTLGTLLGADLLNLRRVRQLEAPVVSIGGAGTFDGIFVTGIVAVLLAAS
jgi:uncharacterized membrane protein